MICKTKYEYSMKILKEAVELKTRANYKVDKDGMSLIYKSINDYVEALESELAIGNSTLIGKNGEPDKTGYQQLAVSAFYKAVNFHPITNSITLGPNAAISKSENEKGSSSVRESQSDTFKTTTPTKPLTEDESYFQTCIGQSTIYSQKDEDKENDDNEGDVYVSGSLEEIEEKLLRKKILTSLENICQAESQAKINNMRIQWLNRDEEAMSRLQEELNATKHSLEEKMIDDFNKRQVVLDELVLEDINHGKSEPLITGETQVLLSSKKVENSNQSSLLKESFEVTNNIPSISQDGKGLSLFTAPKPDDPVALVVTQPSKKEDHSLSMDSSMIPSQLKNESNKPLASTLQPTHGKNKEGVQQETIRKVEPGQPKEISQPSQQSIANIEESISKDEEVSMEEDVIVSNKKETEKTKAVDPDAERVQSIMKHYKKYLKIYSDVLASLKEFMSDDSLKKFRSDCQKAVNVPVNAISGVSASHLNDKLNKLTGLLSGVPVLVNNKSFNASQHRLGVTYCTFLLAEKVVRQGEDAVSVKADSAFPIALVVLEMWKRFPIFGDLLMGVFHKVCPYLVPIYWIKEDGMTNGDYYRKLGFKFIDDQRENIDMFLKRQGGVVRLYFSIVISHLKNSGNENVHPLPLTESWRWLAMFTALEPSAEISATLLYDMLDVTGHSLLRTYGKQFLKLIHLICVHFVPKIEKVTPEGKGGPVSRLKSFLEELIRTQNLKPPKGLLPRNFW